MMNKNGLFRRIVLVLDYHLIPLFGLLDEKLVEAHRVAKDLWGLEKCPDSEFDDRRGNQACAISFRWGCAAEPGGQEFTHSGTRASSAC